MSINEQTSAYPNEEHNGLTKLELFTLEILKGLLSGRQISVNAADIEMYEEMAIIGAKSILKKLENDK